MTLTDEELAGVQFVNLTGPEDWRTYVDEFLQAEWRRSKPPERRAIYDEAVQQSRKHVSPARAQAIADRIVANADLSIAAENFGEITRERLVADAALARVFMEDESSVLVQQLAAVLSHYIAAVAALTCNQGIVREDLDERRRKAIAWAVVSLRGAVESVLVFDLDQNAEQRAHARKNFLQQSEGKAYDVIPLTPLSLLLKAEQALAAATRDG